MKKKIRTKRGVNPFTGAILTVPAESRLERELKQLEKDTGDALIKAMTLDPKECSFCKGQRIEITRRGIEMWKCLDCGIEVSK